MQQQVRAPAAATAPPVAPRRRRWGWLVGRGLGAVALVVAGVVHLQQYFGPYRAIPTIGVLFLLDFAAAVVIGIALLAPIDTSPAAGPARRWRSSLRPASPSPPARS